MRFVFKIGIIFVISLLLIFSLTACKGKKNPDNSGSDDTSSGSKETLSVITGSTDNGGSGDDAHLDISDIFSSTDASSSNPSSSSDSSGDVNSSDSSSGSSSSDSSNDSNTSDSSNSQSSSGIDYNDPNVWTDPV